MSDPLPFHTAEQVSLEAVEREPDRVTLRVATTGPSSACPLCGTPSRHVHSRYTRTLRDLPAFGIPVRIRLTARRFFCRSDACSRRVFTERLPDLAAPYARCTRRLSEALQAVALVLGGEGGCRLTSGLGMGTSADVLLGQLHHLLGPPTVAPRVLGVDDWAWKKGHRYGTILVDLERGRVVDLLPDRTADALAAWLQAHPGVEVITRDRSNLYAEGATRGAPNAVQVADRWHLLRNLTEAAERVLEKRAGLIRRVKADPTAGPIPVEPAALELAAEPAPAPSRGGPAAGSRRAQRQERYEEVVRRRQQGWTLQAVAEAVGLDVRTIRRWLGAGGFPERKARPRAPSKLDPYRAYLDGRVREGCTNAAQLWRELKERGFGGGRTLVRTYVRGLRLEAPSRVPRARRRPSLRRTAWLLTREAAGLGAEERRYVEVLTAQVPELAEVQGLAVAFGRLLREHDVGAFDDWLASAEGSPLAAFVASLRTDERAVRAAVAEAWSNGPVEGHVNRLKLVKRQMYGRASFGLLRARVLRAA